MRNKYNNLIISILASRRILVLAISFLLSFSASASVELGLAGSSNVSSIQSGNQFIYTLNYSVSSLTDVGHGVIADIALPSLLQLTDSVNLNNSVIYDNSQVSSVSYNVLTRTLHVVFVDPFAAGSTGQLQVKLRYPNGVTPNGYAPDIVTTMDATNNTNSVAQGGGTGPVSSNISKVMAVATNVPTVGKSLSDGGAIDNLTIYRLTASNGGSNGSLILNNPVLRDTLPSGVVYVTSTPFSGSNSPITYPIAGGKTVIEWSWPTSLAAGYSGGAYLSVKYTSPTYSIGSTVTNCATIVGTVNGLPIGTQIPQTATGCKTFNIASPSTSAACNGGYISAATASWLNHHVLAGTTNNMFSKGWYNSGNTELDNVTITYHIDEAVDFNTIKIKPVFDGLDSAAEAQIIVTYKTNLNNYVPLGTYYSLSIANGFTPENHLVTLPSGEYITDVKFVINSYGGTKLPIGGKQDLSYNGNVRTAAQGKKNGQPIVEGTTYNPNNIGDDGTIINNNSDGSYTYNGTTVIYDNCIDKSEILSPRPVFYPPTKSIEGGDGTYRASDIVHYKGRFYLGGNQTATGIVVSDTLDSRLIYQIGTSQYYNGTSWISISPVVTMSGAKTVLTYNIGTVTPVVEQFIKFDAQIKPGTAPTSISNRLTVTSTTVNTLFTGPTDNTDLTVISAVALKVAKGQNGSCSAVGEYVYYPTIAHTLPGGNVNYKIVITNQGNVVAKDFILIDALPFIGDSRGSNYFANLASPGTVSDPLSTVSYTTTKNPCSDDLVPAISPAGCNSPTWTTVIPSDLTTVTGIKISRAANLPVLDSIVMTFGMKAPVGVPFGNVMNNSVNYQVSRADNGARLLPATPNQVGMVADCINPIGSLGNYVWVDRNKNGLQDEAASDGLNGVKVYLSKDNGSGTFIIVDSTITGSDFSGKPGYYLFPFLNTGNYQVEFPLAPLDGYQLTTTVNPAPQVDGNSDANTTTGKSGIVHIDENGSGVNKDNLTIDAGYYPVGSLGNYVWYDDNANGLQDEAANRGINGVKIYLYKDNGTGTFVKVDSAVTANDATGNPGYYNFIINNNGNYKVQFPTNIGNTGITVQNGTAAIDGNSDANITTGNTNIIVMDIFAHGTSKNNPTIDAGYQPIGSLGNYVWYDDNNDGINNEPATNGVNGVTVELYKKNGSGNYVLFATTVTADSVLAGSTKPGYYNFPNLRSGDYKVKFPTMVGNYPISDVTNQASQADYNNDADKTTGYSGVVTINVLSTGLNKDNPTIDAGYRTNIGSLGNYVWYDANANGLQDESAANGINGVKVYLYTETAPGVFTKVDSTITATNSGNPGYYNFPNLNTGNYQVEFPTITNNWSLSPTTVTAKTDGNSDADQATGKSPIVAINTASAIALDVNNPTIDAGYQPGGSLGNYVWYDDNGNGIQDEPAARGINGVTVKLYKKDGTGNYVLLATTITADSIAGGSTKPGYYNFPYLLTGDYIVQFPTSVGNYPITDVTNQAPQINLNNDADKNSGYSGVVRISSIGTGLDKDNPTIDAGYKTNIGSLGNYVWTDTNGDGIQNESTTNGINGVKVYLLKETTPGVFVKIDSTVTANNGTNPGYYNFSNLGSANYKVQFPTSVYGASITPTQITTPQTDLNNDADITTGLSPVVVINTSSSNALDINNPTIDAGYLYAPYVCNMTANIGVNQIAQCVTNNNYQFSGNFTGGTAPYTYLWDFNDGTYGYTQNPSHTYATAGEHDVTFIVKDSRGCEAHASTVQIYIGAKPHASFDVYPNSGTGTGVTFSSTSTISGGWLNYNWNLGNGTTSTLVNPGPIYYAPGTYTVTLIATGNFGCSDTASKTITVANDGTITICTTPYASFTVNNATQCLSGNSFVFTNATTGQNNTWNFGDGSVNATSTNATHTYTVAGMYTVTLTASTSCGTTTSTKTITVTNVPAAPAAIAGPSSVVSGNAIVLTDATAGGTWSSSNTAIATVTSYGVVTGLTPGNVTISYTSTNSCGSTSATKVITVTASMPAPPPACIVPVADFTINNATQCLSGNTFVFNNNSSGTAPSYTWNFGDASATVSTINASHTYASANTYNVSLTATNSCGTNTVNKTVTVNDVPAQPAAIGGTTTIQVGATATLTNTTPSGIWSSANTNIATINPTSGVVTGVAPGNATITYTLTNTCGSATRTAVVTVTAAPVPCSATTSTTNASICSGNTYTFNGTTYSTAGTYTAHLTNAGGCDSAATLILTVKATSSSTTNINICPAGLPYNWNGNNYNAAGTYTVHLTNAAGCDSAAQLVLTVSSLPSTPAAITGTTSVVTGGYTSLSNATSGGVWSSSNTVVATISNVGVVNGLSAGSTTISYTVTNACGNVTATTLVTVTAPVVVPPTPVCNLNAGFTINNNTQCVIGNSFVFTNTTIGGTAPYSYLWDLNDGSSATTRDVTKTYATYGDRAVTLRVTDANGCISNAAQQLYIGAKPKASFSILNNTVNGQSKTFISSSTIASGSMTYLWDLGNGSSSTLINPTSNYTPGNYTIKLIVSGLGTCKDTAVQTITELVVASVNVYPNPVMDAVQVSFKSASASATTIKILDLQGRVLQVQTVTPMSAGANVIATFNTRNLLSGSYIIYILDTQNGLLATKQILKQ